jgi:Bacterial transcriptional activator domain
VWIDEIRRSLRDIETRALESYGPASLGIGGTELARRADGASTRRAGPFRESGHRLLETLVAQGSVAEALLAYERLAAVLREGLCARVLIGEACRPLVRRIS